MSSIIFYTVLLVIVLFFSIPKEWNIQFFRTVSFGEELVSQISKRLVQRRFDSFENIARYKYFSLLFLRLLERERTLGVNLSEVYGELRELLVEDLNFEKKAESFRKTSLVQILFLNTYILGVQYYISWTLQGEGRLSTIFCATALWQFCGVMAYFLCYRALRKKILAPYFQYFEVLISLKISMKSYLPLEQILQNIDIEGLGKKFPARYREALVEIVRAMRVGGVLPENELRTLILEIVGDQRVAFEKFKSSLEGLKLGVFFVFTIPAFMFGFYFQMEGFLGQIF